MPALWAFTGDEVGMQPRWRGCLEKIAPIREFLGI